MSSAVKNLPSSTLGLESYWARIKSIDGRHPLKHQVPEACIEYPVRYRAGGRVAYFNFELAKEMGLIPQDYPENLDAQLEKVLLDTFALQIINDHDQMKAKKFPANEIKPNRYMVTRYLQLQHPNKKGLTSGDGRSMWNGTVSFRGKTWDISSCGTGATRLSPACAIHKKHFRTGDPFVAYGCGRASLAEGYSAALMSEVFHKNSIATERTLLLIDFGASSINVRVGENLIRPSHMFRFLKQGDYNGLKKIVDYFINRQESNGYYKALSHDHLKYDNFLKHMSLVFAQATARFESEYIFCWLDWDGDNILAHKAGIIDYGSVRQFGLFHKEYRYDDVERYSTSILEQKHKAKQTIQVFCQLVEYLKTKKRKPLH